MLHMYGIANCDTVKKARRWLDERQMEYVFHDFKKEGVEVSKLQQWSDAIGWENLLNRKGTTWRKLPDADKTDVNENKAIALMQDNTSLIKRPVIESSQGIWAGYEEARFEQLMLSYT